MNQTDFTQPQRQSLAGIVIMFLDTARGFVAALWPILLITLLRGGAKTTYALIAISIVAVLTGIIAWLRYRKFTFYIDEQNAEFVLSEGIINKSRTVIGLDKIQQVSITQSLLQQLVGVHAVEIDTAGSASKEIKIKAVSHDLAQALKSRLLESAVERQSSETHTIQEEKQLISITPGSLFKVGLTSNYIRTIGILLAFSISVWEQIRQVIDSDIIDDSAIDQYMENDFGFSSILFFFGLLMAVVLVFNIGRIMLRYYNYKISVQGRQLLLSYGLLGLKNTIIRPARVQITAVSQNFFQKKLGVLEMRVAQAGMETDENHHKKNRGVDIPGCNPAERDQILQLLYGHLPTEGEPLQPNIRKLLFSVFFSIVLPLGVFSTVWIFIEQASDYLSLVLLFVAVALLANYVAYRNYRLFAGSRMVVKKSGVWDVSKQYVEVAKIQSVSVSQRIWHKGTDIGTLTLHTAGGDVSFRLGNFTQIKQWANQWLYAIEKENTNWM